MSLEDMTDLIEIHDGVMMFDEAFEWMGVSDNTVFHGAGYGAYHGVAKVLKLIERNSKLQPDPDEDYCSTKFYTTLCDTDLDREERAKILLGMK